MSSPLPPEPTTTSKHPEPTTERSTLEPTTGAKPTEPTTERNTLEPTTDAKHRDAVTLESAPPSRSPSTDLARAHHRRRAAHPGATLAAPLAEPPPSPLHPDIAGHVAALLAPLREVLTGVALLRQCTPQTLDLVLSFVRALLSASISPRCCPRATCRALHRRRDWLVTDVASGRVVDDVVHAHPLADLLAQPGPEPGDAIAVHTGFLGATSTAAAPRSAATAPTTPRPCSPLRSAPARSR